MERRPVETCVCMYVCVSHLNVVEFFRLGCWDRGVMCTTLWDEAPMM